MVSSSVMTPRVLLLSTSLGLGGADRQILHLGRALVAHGYEVRLVSMVPLEEMGLQALASGLPVSSLDMPRGRADLRGFRRLMKLLRSWKPHVLTSFMYHANLLARLAGRLAGVSIIVSSVRSERDGSVFRDWLTRLTSRMDHCCTCNSSEVAASLSRRGLLQIKKTRIIPNGVEMTAFSPPAGARVRIRKELGIGKTDFLWLAVGRLTPQKDYATLLQAFQSLADVPTRLIIAGRGELWDEVWTQAQQLGVASRVTLLGVRDDISALLAAADGFVLSSGWEGMPNVVMEALAAATPVVATRVGGVPELVQTGKSGLLVAPRDPSALCQAMRQLMSLSVEQRRAMGLSGREYVAANYSLQAMADRWMALYEELLSK
jgi:glycosyltransferase involved in cell wall biosynthesis